MALCASAATIARADEGGVSFWLPGLYGSLAAVPGAPGWSLSTFLYNTNVSAGADVATAREITIGRFNPTVNLSLKASLSADTGLLWFNPSYTFASQILGGQLTLGLGGFVGAGTTSVSGTVTASVPPFTFVRSENRTDSVTGVGDLYPQATLKWHQGVNNYMVYLTGDIPVGTYSSSSLANLGIGHGAIDGGVGYTYFDETTGHEFSVVTGLTGNFENTATNYTNGIDWHLDWGASQFMTKQFQVGLVGYFYQQLTPDSGCAPSICPFESRVIGIGPQLGYLFPVGDMQGYLNLKAYGEFDNNARPDGWNMWLTFVLSPKAPEASAPSPLLTKAPLYR